MVEKSFGLPPGSTVLPGDRVLGPSSCLLGLPADTGVGMTVSNTAKRSQRSLIPDGSSKRAHCLQGDIRVFNESLQDLCDLRSAPKAPQRADDLLARPAMSLVLGELEKYLAVVTTGRCCQGAPDRPPDRLVMRGPGPKGCRQRLESHWPRPRAVQVTHCRLDRAPIGQSWKELQENRHGGYVIEARRSEVLGVVDEAPKVLDAGDPRCRQRRANPRPVVTHRSSLPVSGGARLREQAEANPS